MRVSGSRYSRDARRLDLAWRLIGFAARTRTVHRWTNLSAYKIRALYRGRIEADPTLSESPLHGAAPSQIGFLWQSALVKCEVAILAGLLRVFDVIPNPSDRIEPDFLPGIVRGERLCRAYAEFRALLPNSRVSIEHGILLLTELVRGKEVALGLCASCHSLLLVDNLALGSAQCAYCDHEKRAGSSRAASPPIVKSASLESDCAAREKPSHSPDRQGNLF